MRKDGGRKNIRKSGSKREENEKKCRQEGMEEVRK